jgi:calcium/calmodulin-dependent protein kinase I
LVRFQLKSGASSSVCRGTHRASGRVVAIKCVRRATLSPENDAAIYDEISVLSSLGRNPSHIVPLLDFFEEADTYFLVKELLTGDNVLERISGMGYRYNERIARGIVLNIMEALSTCHRRNIAHRDVNSKNIIFINEDKNLGIKLAGFGFAARCHAPESMTRQCGTPLFVAPEILLKKPYGMESDMWSAGCLAFLLLSGGVPFAGTTQKELFRAIVAGKYEYNEYWRDVSAEGKVFVSDLLQVDPYKRLKAEEAFNHPWMKLPESELSPRILEDASLRIRDFHRTTYPPEDTNSN